MPRKGDKLRCVTGAFILHKLFANPQECIKFGPWYSFFTAGKKYPWSNNQKLLPCELQHKGNPSDCPIKVAWKDWRAITKNGLFYLN